MRIFVINLERRPDRLESIATRLNMLGLEFERVQAFDGMNNSVKHLVSWPKAILFNYLQRPSLGVIGCYQSHRLVFQKIVKDKIPQALVLEDDAELHDWDPEILKVNISDIGLELLRLEASDLTEKSESAVGTALLGRKFYNIQTSSAGAYIITESGAKKCLSLGKFWIPLDVYDSVSRLTSLKTAVLLPVMSKQGGSVSDLSSTPKIPTSNFEKTLSGAAELWWRLRRPWLRTLRNAVVSLEARKHRRRNSGNT